MSSSSPPKPKDSKQSTGDPLASAASGNSAAAAAPTPSLRRAAATTSSASDLYSAYAGISPSFSSQSQPLTISEKLEALKQRKSELRERIEKCQEQMRHNEIDAEEEKVIKKYNSASILDVTQSIQALEAQMDTISDTISSASKTRSSKGGTIAKIMLPANNDQDALLRMCANIIDILDKKKFLLEQQTNIEQNLAEMAELTERIEEHEREEQRLAREAEEKARAEREAEEKRLAEQQRVADQKAEEEIAINQPFESEIAEVYKLCQQYLGHIQEEIVTLLKNIAKPLLGKLAEREDDDDEQFCVQVQKDNETYNINLSFLESKHLNKFQNPYDQILIKKLSCSISMMRTLQSKSSIIERLNTIQTVLNNPDVHYEFRSKTEEKIINDLNELLSDLREKMDFFIARRAAPNAIPGRLAQTFNKWKKHYCNQFQTHLKPKVEKALSKLSIEDLARLISDNHSHMLDRYDIECQKYDSHGGIIGVYRISLTKLTLNPPAKFPPYLIKKLNLVRDFSAKSAEQSVGMVDHNFCQTINAHGSWSHNILKSASETESGKFLIKIQRLVESYKNLGQIKRPQLQQGAGGLGLQ